MIKVAEGNGSVTISHATIDQIMTTITENKIDVAIFEPLITLHGVPENDNTKMNLVVHLFGGIASGCECSIDICAHTRKLMPGVEEFVTDDLRGAGSSRDAFRGMRVLSPMSKLEATQVDIEEQDRPFHFRVDRGKANYLPPAAKGAVWRKFESVDLPNGDQVGVVTPWAMPDAPLTLSDDDCEWLQKEVEAGDTAKTFAPAHGSAS